MKSSTLTLAVVVVVLSTFVDGATLSCDKCFSPTFQKRELYLPFCSEDGQRSFANLCEALCDPAGTGKATKGSCDKCEETKCSAIFLPVCSADQKRIFPNACHAKCSGVESVECDGLGNFIVPGKSPLPPNFELPARLQNVETRSSSSAAAASDDVEQNFK